MRTNTFIHIFVLSLWSTLLSSLLSFAVLFTHALVPLANIYWLFMIYKSVFCYRWRIFSSVLWKTNRIFQHFVLKPGCLCPGSLTGFCLNLSKSVARPWYWVSDFSKLLIHYQSQYSCQFYHFKFSHKHIPQRKLMRHFYWSEGLNRMIVGLQIEPVESLKNQSIPFCWLNISLFRVIRQNSSLSDYIFWDSRVQAILFNRPSLSIYPAVSKHFCTNRWFDL